MSTTDNSYDIAIVGAGAAGLHLAMAFCRSPFFSDKKILLLEKDGKDENDRTWCFWEKGAGRWDPLLRQSWEKGDFFGREQHKALELLPYRYKMLRAADFYGFAKQQLAAHPNVAWQRDEVLDVQNGPTIRIDGRVGEYRANWVFDSRVPPEFLEQPTAHAPCTVLLQHFKGWYVRTPDDRFDPSRFTMMDYRLRYGDTSSFTYVLPLGPREALVEFTLFSPSLIPDGDYDLLLRQYCSKVLKINDLEILEVEKGVIPMSDFPFQRYSSGRHVRIGTGGGWVKASSGYAFKNCERHADRIAENLACGRPANAGLFKRRFQFYDAVFLDVLHRRNDLGPQLFETMYFKNDVRDSFAFLDGDSTVAQDLGIIAGFPKLLFLHSLLQTRFGRVFV